MVPGSQCVLSPLETRMDFTVKLVTIRAMTAVSLRASVLAATALL